MHCPVAVLPEFESLQRQADECRPLVLASTPLYGPEGFTRPNAWELQDADTMKHYTEFVAAFTAKARAIGFTNFEVGRLVAPSGSFSDAIKCLYHYPPYKVAMLFAHIRVMRYQSIIVFDKTIDGATNTFLKDLYPYQLSRKDVHDNPPARSHHRARRSVSTPR